MTKRRTGGWLFFLLIAATGVAYFPAYFAGFVWNDSDYVTAPELQSWHGLAQIWFKVGATQQYYPLLHSAFWVEHRLWGDQPFGYHLVNVLFHALSACLLVVLLRRLFPQPAGAEPPPGHAPFAAAAPWLAGFIFALHPVCAESVAWITEQKNTLSTVFYLAAAIAYFLYRDRSDSSWADAPATHSASGATRRVKGKRAGVQAQPSPVPSPRWGAWLAYSLALALYTAAVLSKSVAATLPGALLVGVWWRRGRLSWRRDIVPLLPWFVVGAAIGLFTGYVEKKYIGAEGTDFTLTAVERFLVAGRVVWFYVGKFLWPAHLVFIYPRWKVSSTEAWQYLYPVGLAAVLVALWGWRRRARGPLCAALLFVGALFPLLGFFNVYAFVFSFVADHWQYLAVLAAAGAAAGGWAWLGANFALGPGRLWRRAVLLAVPLVALAGSAALTWRESGNYHDLAHFYDTIVERNPDCWMAYNNLGDIYFKAGDRAQARWNYEKALALRPVYPDAQNNLGVVLMGEGKYREAIARYLIALRSVPAYADARNNYGSALAALGERAAATEQFKIALRLRPNFCEAWVNLGNMLLAAGKRPEALAAYRRGLKINPEYPEGLNNLGVVLSDLGRTDEAIAQYRICLRLAPNYPECHNNLGNALRATGHLSEAIGHYEEAVRLAPAYAQARSNLGAALADAGRFAEGQAQEEAALRLDPQSGGAEDALGKILLHGGHEAEAEKHLRTAVALAPEDARYEDDLGIALLQSGQAQSALAPFQAAVRLDPNMADAENNLCAAYAQLGRAQEAEVHFRAALRIRPVYPEAHSNFGVALGRAGRLSEAVAQYEEAIRLNPSFANARENLATILTALGRKAEAAAQLDQVARLKSGALSGKN